MILKYNPLNLLLIEGFESFDQLHIYFRGYVVRDGKIYEDAEFIPFVKADYLNGRLDRAVPTYNGSFHLVVADFSKSKVVVAMDRYGTLPLYYSHKKDEIAISTNWRYLVNSENSQLRKDATLEMVVFGHVLGDKTMIENVYEFGQHTITTIDLNNTIKLNKESYYAYQLYFNPANLKQKEKEFTELWREKFSIYSNHIREKGNNRIFVAVTGGLDSRLIASELDRNAVSILPMTYGHQLQNYEIQSALKIVDTLKHKFGHVIQYHNPALMEEILKESPTTSRITCGHFAEKDLYFVKLISKYCKYSASGHAGGTFIGGPVGYRMKTWKSYDHVKNHVARYKSLSAWPTLQGNKELKDVIFKSLNDIDNYDTDYVTAYMRWFLEERHRRYTLRSIIPDGDPLQVNLLPYFDYDLADFFVQLPYEALVSKKLFINAQMKYLYSHNPGLKKVSNNGKKMKIIRSSFFTEFSGKAKMVMKQKLKVKNSAPGKLYQNSINWKDYIDFDLIPDVVNLQNYSGIMYFENTLYAISELQKEINRLLK